MSTKTVIATNKAPAAIGPYSQAIRTGNLLFCSGQVPLDPETMELEKADITLQTRKVLKNIKAVLEAAGAHAGQVVKTTIYLTSMNDFAAVNKEYEEFFKTEGQGNPPPARSTVAVAALPKAAMVEIEVIAAL